VIHTRFGGEVREINRAWEVKHKGKDQVKHLHASLMVFWPDSGRTSELSDCCIWGDLRATDGANEIEAYFKGAPIVETMIELKRKGGAA
jgi:hypothetical protein